MSHKDHQFTAQMRQGILLLNKTRRCNNVQRKELGSDILQGVQAGTDPAISNVTVKFTALGITRGTIH